MKLRNRQLAGLRGRGLAVLESPLWTIRHRRGLPHPVLVAGFVQQFLIFTFIFAALAKGIGFILNDKVGWLGRREPS